MNCTVTCTMHSGGSRRQQIFPNECTYIPILFHPSSAPPLLGRLRLRLRPVQRRRPHPGAGLPVRGGRGGAVRVRHGVAGECDRSAAAATPWPIEAPHQLGAEEHHPGGARLRPRVPGERIGRAVQGKKAIKKYRF